MTDAEKVEAVEELMSWWPEEGEGGRLAHCLGLTEFQLDLFLKYGELPIHYEPPSCLFIDDPREPGSRMKDVGNLIVHILLAVMVLGFFAGLAWMIGDRH